MNTAYAFRVRLPAMTPPAVQLSLQHALERSGATVQEPLEPKSLDLDWSTFVAIMKDVSEVTNAMTGLVTLGSAITTWRKNLRDQGQPVQGTLEKPGQPDLDLATATDEEVLAWLLKQ